MHTRLYLTPADHGRALSWDEFASADAQGGYRYEMIEGRVFVSPAANAPHNAFEIWLQQVLSTYAREHPEVVQFIATRARVFLPDHEPEITAPEPDIACFAEFAPNPYASDIDWRDFSPILVVEVISADTADKDLVRNRRLYLQVQSIREYWILDPREGVEGLTMLVYRRRGRRWAACLTVAPGATYTTPMLPGFALVLDPLA
jgi:Uma2 family endonuclease